MHSNNYEWMIHQTVESMLPTFHHRGICLAMKIRVDWHYYPEDHNDLEAPPECQFRKEFMLVFYRPDNYTKVFLKDVTNENVIPNQKEMTMKRISDHDSCWKTDGMGWIFKSFVEAWDYFDKYGIEGRNIEPSFHYNIFRGSPTYYHVELEELEENEKYEKFFNVKLGEPIPMYAISQYMSKPEGYK